MCSMNDIPAEVLLKILSHLPGEDVSRSQKVSKKFYGLVSAFPFHLQSVRCRVEAKCGDELSLIVQQSDSNKSIELARDLWHQVCRMEISELTITGVDGQNQDQAVEQLIQLFKETRQFSMRIVTIKDVSLQNPVLAQTLLRLLSSTFVQELNLQCPISEQLTPLHVQAMDSLCQLRVEEDQGHLHLETANAVVSKFATDMRFKPRLNIPFVADVDRLDPDVVLALIKEWIFIPESPMFQIKFTHCDVDWLNRFHNLCEVEQIKHVFYEFSSKSNPYAHLKLKVHEETNTCTIFPVKDVPARSPIQPYVCFARYFRDF